MTDAATLDQFGQMVAGLRAYGVPLDKAEARVRELLGLPEPSTERDENVREKEEQLAIRMLAITYGFKVRNLSQARKSRIAFGTPDLLLTHNALPIALWWESKRQVGGSRSTPQIEFADDMIRCRVGYGFGDRYAFVEKLIELELAVRGAGQYGIEPIRLSPHGASS